MVATLVKLQRDSGRSAAALQPAITSEFVAPKWRSTLAGHEPSLFKEFWNMPGEDVEEPNIGRGGWSRVIRCQLEPCGIVVMYVKRQFHYQTRNWRCLLRGEPTLQREFRNIEHCRRHGVPTASLIYFATGRIQGVPVAILATEALTEVQPLNVFLESLSPENRKARRNALEMVARSLARLHRSGLKHGCLYPKHILLPRDPAAVEQLRFIDLEKARPYLFRGSALRRDFGTLFRRLPMCTAEERELFLQIYESQWHEPGEQPYALRSDAPSAPRHLS